MEQRDRFIAERREAARTRGLAFRMTPGRGEGGHAVAWVGHDRRTTLPSRDIDPKTARKSLRTLGLD